MIVMISAQRTIMFAFFLSFLMVAGTSFCTHAPQQQTKQELIVQVVSQLHTIHNALDHFNEHIKNGLIQCVNYEETIMNSALVQSAIEQVVASANDHMDIQALQFFCAFDDAMIKCASWLCTAGNTHQMPLNFDAINADELPDDLEQLQRIVEDNEQRCLRLIDQMTTLVAPKNSELVAPAWYTRVVATVAKYTTHSKLFVGVTGSALGLYLLSRIIKKNKAKATGPNAYDGVAVTPDNLYDLAPKVCSALAKKLSQWFKDNQDAWHALVKQEGNYRLVGPKQMWGNAVLAGKGLRNVSEHSNFVFVFPDTDMRADGPIYLVKISGPINRICLQVANQNKPYGSIGLVDPGKFVPTYQTASRMFHGPMRLEEAIKKYGLTEIELVEKYLWSPSRSCEDRECVVVAKVLRNHFLLRDCQEHFDEILTKKRIVQLLLAAKYAGLWNLTETNILVNCTTHQLAFIDTEQPNTTKPSQAFDKDHLRYRHNINAGVQSLYKLLPQGSKQREYVEQWARNDTDIMDAPNVKDLLVEFEANKQHVRAQEAAQEKEQQEADQEEQ